MVARMQREEEWGMNASGCRAPFWNDENILELSSDDGCTAL